MLSCALYYITSVSIYIDEQENQRLSELHFKFREELQWLGDEGYINGMPRMVLANGEEINFNSDNSMDKYDEPLYVKKSFFEQFLKIKYVNSSMLVYTENIYNAFSTDPDDKLKYCTLLYGGSLSSIEYIRNTGNFVLSDGTENKQGECLIYKNTAMEYRYNIGDYITYTDIDGNILGKLRISGFFSIKDGFGNYITDDDTYYIRMGSNPFFVSFPLAAYMIITDFDTAYYAYGNNEDSEDFLERHEFNKYMSWYTLDNFTNFEQFLEETKKFEYSDTLSFYPNQKMYLRNIELPVQIINVAKIFTLITLFLSLIIFAVLIIYTCNERKHEIGILYSLGATKLQIILNFTYELLIYSVFISGISVISGRFVLYLTLINAPYITKMNINYVITPSFLLMLFGSVIGIAVVTSIVSTAYISVCSPSVLIAERNR